MAQFEMIAGSLNNLTTEEKLKLRTLIDSQLSSEAENGNESSQSIIGFFKNEPELIDVITSASRERRTESRRNSPS